MTPLDVDGYLFDLYKGGDGRAVLMIQDSMSDPPGHVDVDVSSMLQALSVLWPLFSVPIPEDPDIETSQNKALEAS